MREIQLNMYHALALGAVMYWLGAALTRKLPALRRFCVPAPLVGGLCFALFNTLLYASGLAVITFDETLETVFMILFFTTVGFTVSIPMLVKSGPHKKHGPAEAGPCFLNVFAGNRINNISCFCSYGQPRTSCGA